MTPTTQKTFDYILEHLRGVRRSANGQYVALCPCHDDHQPSLSAALGDDGKILLHCHANCPTENIVENLGLKMSDLFPKGDGHRPTVKRRIVSTYDYVDEQSHLLFQTVRYEPKGFAQRRPDGKGGWKWDLQGVRRVLYHLPELVQMQPGELVFVCEGEKSADAIRSLGVVATCNPMGAGKWRPEYAEMLRDKRVIILPDNDDAGRKHARQVARALFGIGAGVRILWLPNLNDKDDPFDWVQRGGNRNKLLKLAQDAPRLAMPASPPDGPQTLRSQIAIPDHAVDQGQGLAPESPDPELREKVLRALLETTAGSKGRTKQLPAILRRSNAGHLVLAWLQDHGGLVHSESGELYYFYAPKRRLFPLDSDRWEAWLHSLTSVNPAGVDYAHIQADCKTTAIQMPKRKVVQVAYWDAKRQVLRISRFDGTVYVLDGETIQDEPNGEHVIFEDDPAWQPYEPTFDGTGALTWSTSDLPNWESDGDAYGLAFRVWALTTFFCELCPTRPMAVFLGEKGSGKSMALRVLLRLLFGPRAEISGVPDKPDGFTAAAAAAHILVLDNLDQRTGWLRDKLARISTGAEDYYRKLYTSNERGRVTYRCWLAFTARTPDTLKRDDLADRLLLLPVVRIEDDQKLRETDVYHRVAQKRGPWWGNVLTALNAAVASIRRGELCGKSQLRMADWEALGRVFAQNEDKIDTWNRFVARLKRSQSDFLLKDDLIVDGLNLWLQNAENHGREANSRELHSELTLLLFQGKKPPSDWPKSTHGFSMHLSNMRRELQNVFTVSWHKPKSGPNRERFVYTFSWKQASSTDSTTGPEFNSFPKIRTTEEPISQRTNGNKPSSTGSTGSRELENSTLPSLSTSAVEHLQTTPVCSECGAHAELEESGPYWQCSNRACSEDCLWLLEVARGEHEHPKPRQFTYYM